MRKLGLLIFSFTALVVTHSACANDDWVNDLPVKPNFSSKRYPKIQEVILDEVFEFKYIKDKAWLSGHSPTVYLDSKRSSISVGGGLDVEITFDSAKNGDFRECAEVIRSTIDSDKSLKIAGAGRYKTYDYQGVVNGIVIELANVTECEVR